MTWSAIRWGNLEASWAFFGILLLLLFVLYKGWRQRKTLEQFGAGSVFHQMVESVSLRKQKFKLLSLVLGVSLVVTALMQPRYGVRDAKISNTGIDVVFVLDVSKSMKVRDVVPDRLEAAKTEIVGLLDLLRGGRVALVPFAGIPFVQCPLTSDFDVIRSYLSELTIEDMPVGGTNLGRALQLAVQVLENEEASAGDGNDQVAQFTGSNHKAIVLFTDGENHEGAPMEVAEGANGMSLRIFTVGMGSASGNPVPVLTEDGAVSGYMKDEDGKPIISMLDQSLLTELARSSGGQFFHYADRSVASPLFEQLDSLEQMEYNEKYVKLGEERFQWLLFPGWLLILLSTLITNRARGSIRVMGVLLSFLVAGSMGSSPTWAQENHEAPDWTYTTHPDVDEGNEAINRGDGPGATGAYGRAGEELPESAELHYNRGLALLLEGKAEDATDAFTRAMTLARRAFLPEHHFALGLSYAEQAVVLEEEGIEGDLSAAREMWTLAVESFEESLILSSGSERAAWNLELALIGQCRTENDPFEPNDSREEAHTLELAENPETKLLEGAASFTLCLGDTDWATLELGAGHRIEVDVKRSGNGASDAAQVQVFLGTEQEPVETLHWGDGGLQSWKFHNMVQAQAITFKIYSTNGDDHSIDIDVSVRPPCSNREDSLEDNDTQYQASAGAPGDAPLHICPNDPDWFRVEVAEGESLFAVASAEGEWTEGFSLVLTDLSGKALTTPATHENTQIALLLEPPPGSYWAEVRGGVDVDADYSLMLQNVPPCPEGNDPLEPNDTPMEAKSLDALQAPQGQMNPGGGMPMLPSQPGRLPPGLQGVPRPPGGAGQPPVFPPGPQMGATPPVPMPMGGMPPGGPPMPTAAGGAPGGQQGPQTALLRICGGDTDFIKVVVPPDTSQIATILFDHRKGDLDLTLLDEKGEEVLMTSASSAPDVHAEVIQFPKEKEEERTYLLKIEGNAGAENFYVLRLDSPQGGGSQDSSDSDEENEEGSEDQEPSEQDENDEQEEEEKEPEPEEPEEQDAMSKALEQLDKNNRNLEAEEALKKSLLRGQPKRDW